MRHENSLMHDVLKPMPWGAFDRLVDKHGADQRVRKLPTKSQFIALAYGQLCGAHSLRDIEARLASQAARLYHLGAQPPKRSTPTACARRGCMPSCSPSSQRRRTEA
jgi:hypothetical protein